MPRSSSDKRRANKDPGEGVEDSWSLYSSSQQQLSNGDVLPNETESRGTRRLRKQAPNGSTVGRPPEPTPKSAVRPDPTASTAASRRRQSSVKLPSLPSSLQASPSKRSTGESTLRQPIPGSYRDLSSNGSSTHSRQTSINSTARYSMAATIPTKGEARPPSASFDFLPSVNFDDLHSSLFSDMPDIGSFPAPGGSTFKQLEFDTMPLANTMSQKEVIAKPMQKHDMSAPSNMGSVGKATQQEDGRAQDSSDMLRDSHHESNASQTGSQKGLRKSLFPSSAKSSMGKKAPRKSVGPGILTSGAGSQASPHRPSLAQAGLHVSSDARIGNGSLLGSESHGFETSRYQKAKSFQATPRKSHESSRSYSTHGSNDVFGESHTSPARPRTQGSLTPSSNKRLSVLPNSAHATGLAARTISPTDARRIKRMSMMPNVPPLPFTPPTPQPDTPSSAGMPSAPSPSLLPRKSVTPSSSRTTPEHNRKSYSSGFSISSSTSYNSNSGHPAARAAQIVTNSRLPTPKSRVENLSLGDDEIVPPVPAIPKAFESPKEELAHPFPSYRKPSLNNTTNGLPSHQDDASLRASQIAFANRSQNNIAEPATERKPSANNTNRRTLQPLRLPPLNLLPLSAPTANKIAALYDGSGSKGSGSVTPPPKKGQKATPTTPMTASKASFGQGYPEDESRAKPVQIRSSSSHHNMRSEALPFRASSSSSTMVPGRPDSTATYTSRAAISPFISSSLPKSSGEFNNHLRREVSHPADAISEQRTGRLTGPRSQKPRKASKDESSFAKVDSSVEKPTTPSFGSSLRRKLSLTRRKSVSRSQNAAESDNEQTVKDANHDDMPPPRLPASATWNGPLSSPTPSQKSRGSRNVSNASTIVHHERNRSSTWDAGETPKKALKPATAAGNVASKRTTRSFLESASHQNGSTLKEFITEANHQTADLDTDDHFAEEEMKRLAGKRKETDAAAKQLDSLTRRATAKERVSPSAALRVAKLNIFERGEIVDYRDIFFCGTQNAKKHVGDLSDTATNFGYDDERGDYNITAGDHLSYRYEIIDILGKGSFGQVVRCIDHKSGLLVAIKIIRNKKRFHQQALVEVDILQKLREWDPNSKHGMVSFTQSFYFRGHLCISTELLGMNLYEFIKCYDFRGFSLKLIRRFAKQLLSSLVLLKSKRVIHCDLKPENVLLAHPARSEVKVIDFGSSCHENEKVYTYIQSRFYRSPEVILGMTYGMPIDMWSLGCILAELLTGYPIFPGENEQEQLACIMEVFGPPEKHLIERSTRKKLFFDSLGKPRITVSSKGKRRRPSSKSLQQVLKCEDEGFLDFITRCLRWDPDRRLKPDEAMRHEFITGRPSKSQPLRPRTAPHAAPSPMKRFNSITHSARPLPDPPAATSRTNNTGKNRDTTSSNAGPSPIKRTPSHRRNSTLNVVPNSNAGIAAGTKRTITGSSVTGSALPRASTTPRIANPTGPAGKGGSVDLASAAAVASLRSR